MLKLIDLIPSYYIKNSRDMQILTRVFEVIFNYCKTNTDLVYEGSKDINVDMQNLMDLNLITLGFKQSHEYNLSQLQSLLSIFREIIRNKGNIKAIELTLELLAEVEDCEELPEILYYKDLPYNLIISIPEKIKDLSLFNDVLNYIIPSGVSFEIQHTLQTNSLIETDININNESTFKVYKLGLEQSDLINSNISSQIPQTKFISEKKDTLYSNQTLNVPTTEAEMTDLQNDLKKDITNQIIKENQNK